jgi:hypothetical protein
VVNGGGEEVKAARGVESEPECRARPVRKEKEGGGARAGDEAAKIIGEEAHRRTAKIVYVGSNGWVKKLTCTEARR